MNKKFFRQLPIILFTISVFFLLHPFSWSEPLTTSFLLLLNFTIILSANYFSATGVLIFGGFSLFAVFLYNLRNLEFTTFPIVSLIATTGILYVYFLKINSISRRINSELGNIEEERNILTAELEHFRLENVSLKQKLQRYTTLKGLTETLSSTLSFDEIAALIKDETFRIIGKSCVSLLYLVDKEKQELSLVSTRAAEPKYEVKLAKGDIFDNWVFKQHLPLIVEDTNKDFRFNIDKLKKDLRDVRSLISAPLISENKLLGILRLDNISYHAYEADDLRLLDIISHLAALTIENALRYQETQKLAITDGLTDLFVHRYFQERFAEEISRALWTNSQFAFLMIDIDDFKHFNDSYGHISGDVILKKIAKLISLNVNPGDIVARYGGEEFAVLLVNTHKSGALKIAEKIREKIEKEKFILRRETTKVSISGGISFFPDDGKIKTTLIARADQALYKAKAEGKNRICTF